MNNIYIQITYNDGEYEEHNVKNVSVYKKNNHILMTRYDEKEQAYISTHIQLDDINSIKVYTKD